MSVAVSIPELPAQIRRFDLGPYLMTVSPDSTPRATSIAVRWEGENLVAGLGRRTGANVLANGSVTLLWPAPVCGEHALIVDGSASVRQTPDGATSVVIRPFKAVLHVTRG